MTRAFFDIAFTENVKGLQARMPMEHYMMGMPAGLSPERFLHYAEVFAQDVLPAFS